MSKRYGADNNRDPIEPEQVKIQAQLEILRSFRRNDFKLDSVYEAGVIGRIRELNEQLNKPSKLNRLEVIDDTGRAYTNGSMYGTPVSLHMSYQDGGRTLKIFVENR